MAAKEVRYGEMVTSVWKSRARTWRLDWCFRNSRRLFDSPYDKAR